MKTDRISPPRRVLMIAGAAFTDSVVLRQTALLKKDGGYRFHGFAFGTDRIRPGHAPVSEVFERHIPYPGTNGKFPLFPGVFRAIPDAIATTFSCNPELPDVWRERFGERTIHWRYASVRRALAGFDLYHWHCFEPWRLHWAQLLPPNARLIITLWGSDLFRTTGIQGYARQLAVSKKATAFTMASPEMREIFLSKFGRELAGRVYLQTYGSSNFSPVRDARQSRPAFLAKLEIPEDKVVICLGHSGAPENRHLEVIDAIESFSRQRMERIAVIIPMTYGHTAEYLDKVRIAAGRLSAPVRIIDRYLEDADIVALRGAADITIHVPVSDQMSAAMCESLYAGSVLITGAWLPYSLLLKKGFYYHTVDSLDELPDRLQTIIANLEEERQRTWTRSAPMHDFGSWDSVIPQWLRLYDKICSLPL
jgi:hypothetical protein